MSMDSQPASLWRNFSMRYRLLQSAILISWSTVYAAPTGLEDNSPYIVAIIECEDGSRVCVQLTDLNELDLKYGMKLNPVFRKMYDSGEKGVIPYGTKYTKGS